MRWQVRILEILLLLKIRVVQIPTKRGVKIEKKKKIVSIFTRILEIVLFEIRSSSSYKLLIYFFREGKNNNESRNMEDNNIWFEINIISSWNYIYFFANFRNCIIWDSIIIIVLIIDLFFLGKGKIIMNRETWRIIIFGSRWISSLYSRITF